MVVTLNQSLEEAMQQVVGVDRICPRSYAVIDQAPVSSVERIERAWRTSQEPIDRSTMCFCLSRCKERNQL